MAWTKRTVTDQNVEYPNRFKIDGVPSIIEPDFGTIVEAGTPINKAYLQPIEDYLETVDGSLEGNADAIANHSIDLMPHQFTDGVTIYRWGLSMVDGVLTFNYEEVI